MKRITLRVEILIFVTTTGNVGFLNTSVVECNQEIEGYSYYLATLKYCKLDKIFFLNLVAKEPLVKNMNTKSSSEKLKTVLNKYKVGILKSIFREN